MGNAGGRTINIVEGDERAVDRQLSAAASAVKAHLLEVSQDLWADMVRSVPQLDGDETVVSLLAASVESNVATLLHLLELGLVPESLDAPSAAVEYARRLAQREVPLTALVRAYRLGHGRFLGWCLDALRREVNDADVLETAARRLVDLSFRYIDRISELVISAYQEERDRWLITRTAARRERVRALLDGKQVNINSAERAMGYRLHQRHLGLVSWIPEPTEGGAGLARLDRLTDALAAALDCLQRPLFVPYDESVAWSWFPLGGRNDVDWTVVPKIVEVNDPTARVAAGDPAPGVTGFRQTHSQALHARRVADVARPSGRATLFTDVGPVALLLGDVEATRSWVWLVLGDLARDDPNASRLRDTLQVFLSSGSSYTAAAQYLQLHRNTVQYRVRRAKEALGRPIGHRRAEVELALRVCHEVGSPMLRPAAPDAEV
jgi:hypothetical protein